MLAKLDNSLIDQYLESLLGIWSDSTLRTARARLVSMRTPLSQGEPAKLWTSLAGRLKPYSRCTSWIIVIGFVDWQIKQGMLQGPNKYREFKENNPKLFNNKYRRNLPQIGFSEALKRLRGLEHRASQEKALQLIYGGLRWTESHEVSKDGICTGKGGKQRKIFNYRDVQNTVPYYTFRRQLAKVGLKPHDLRKIFASELVRRGIGPFELKEIMGWSSVSTAEFYINCDEEKLRTKVMELV